MTKRITANQREGLSVADSITGTQFYVEGNSSDGSINVNVTSASTVPTNITEIGGTPIALGSALSASSLPVTIASDNTPVTIDTENLVVKDDFPGTTLDDTKWTVQTNAGSAMSYAITGSLLTISANTTASDYLVFTSVQTFTLPFRAQFLIQASQRIANNNLYLELVNAAGTTVTAIQATVASPGVTQAAYNITGTVVTTANIVSQNQGTKNTADAGVTSVTTASYGIYEIDAYMDTVTFQTRTVDVAAASSTNSNMRERNQLDPGEQYYVQIRCLNSGAPATNTNFNIEMVGIQDTTDTPVTIASGRGNNDLSRTVPVAISGGSSTVFVSRQASSTGSNSVDMNFGTAVTHESKSSSANLLAFYFTSYDTAETVYLQFFNATSATGTPVYSFPVGPAASASIPTVLTVGEDFFGVPGHNFSTALTWGISTTLATYSAASTASNYVITVNYI